jgi:TRAP-type uncharacterized transport system substrate-binding protein
VGVVFVGMAHALTYADSGIRPAKDLAGKRVAVGIPGSGTFASAERVFRALGVWDKINRIPLLGAQAVEAMSDGKADTYFWTGPEPDVEYVYLTSDGIFASWRKCSPSSLFRSSHSVLLSSAPA